MLTQEQINDLYNRLDQLHAEKKYVDELYLIDTTVDAHQDQNDIQFYWNLNKRAGLTALHGMGDFQTAVFYLLASYTDFRRIDGGFLDMIEYYLKAEHKPYHLILAYSLVAVSTNMFPDAGCSEIIYGFNRHLLHAQICKEIGTLHQDTEKLEDALHAVNKALEFKHPIDMSDEDFDTLTLPARDLRSSLHEALEKMSNE